MIDLLSDVNNIENSDVKFHQKCFNNYTHSKSLAIIKRRNEENLEPEKAISRKKKVTTIRERSSRKRNSNGKENIRNQILLIKV